MSDFSTIGYTISIVAAVIIACACWKCTPIRSATGDNDEN